MLRLGILGCGAIGTELATFASGERGVRSIALYDLVPGRSRGLARRLRKAKAVGSVKELIEASDVIAETASQTAVRRHVEPILAAGKSVLLLSMGALADDRLRKRIVSAARKSGAKLYLPSGAVAAVDALKAGALAGIKSVTLVTTKPPKALGLKVKQWTVLFDGPARQAVKRFPQNVNVAACLSIAGIGFDRTRVQVVADPLATRNAHKLIVEGDFGRIRCEVENLPSPKNPKTSWLASLSAIATLKRLLDPVEIGA